MILVFWNLFDNKFNDKHKRFGTKIIWMHLREICKSNLFWLWSNPTIELSITTLKISWNPFFCTWTVFAHLIKPWMWNHLRTIHSQVESTIFQSYTHHSLVTHVLVLKLTVLKLIIFLVLYIHMFLVSMLKPMQFEIEFSKQCNQSMMCVACIQYTY